MMGISIALTALWLAALTGCAAEGSSLDDDSTWLTREPLVEGSSLKDTALYASEGEATMYQWASRSAPVLRVLPEEAVVRVGNPTPKQGFYQVIHAGTWGWIYGGELTERHGPTPGLSQRRLEALRLAQSAMGFSYWWSNARWKETGPTIMPESNHGHCDGNCPKCTHSATGSEEYGADCSGFVSTIWGLPDTDPNTNPTNNGYSTKAYAKANNRWSTISLDEAITGDAVVRHDNQRQHIFLVGAATDEMGRMATYECVGCEPGCRTRKPRESSLTQWTAIRRTGWPTH
jgi:hypothetical protein